MASNIATCVIATTLWPAPGTILDVTNATAFSFQAVMTSARADGAVLIMVAAAMSILRILAGMVCSFYKVCSFQKSTIRAWRIRLDVVSELARSK
jgi:hypothetical protein